MSSSTAPRRSPRLAAAAAAAAAKAAEVARKASCIPAGPPNTFVSTIPAPAPAAPAPAPAAPAPAPAVPAPAPLPPSDAAIVQEIKVRLNSVMNCNGLSMKCNEATRLMNFVRTEGLDVTKKYEKFRLIVIDKCYEFYHDRLTTRELKDSCAALLLALGAPHPAPAPAPAPAPSVAAAAAAFSAPVEEDCAYFASQLRPTSSPSPPPARPTITIHLPSRPTETDKTTVCAHMAFLLNIACDTTTRADQFVVNTEIFQYILATQHLLSNAKFRTTIRAKVEEFNTTMAEKKIDCPPLTDAMKSVMNVINYLENIAF